MWQLAPVLFTCLCVCFFSEVLNKYLQSKRCIYCFEILPCSSPRICALLVFVLRAQNRIMHGLRCSFPWCDDHRGIISQVNRQKDNHYKAFLKYVCWAPPYITSQFTLKGLCSLPTPLRSTYDIWNVFIYIFIFFMTTVNTFKIWDFFCSSSTCK